MKNCFGNEFVKFRIIPTRAYATMPWNHWSAERLGIALAVLAALGFSPKAIFVKLAYAAAPVEAVTLPRCAWCLRCRCSHGRLFRQPRGAAVFPARLGQLVALGLLGYYASSMLDFLGLQYISAGLERLILFCHPTLTVLIGVLFMGRLLEKRQVGALVLSYAGIGLAFVHDLHVADNIAEVLVGAGFVFASALTYAFYSAGAESVIHRLGSTRFAANWRCWCPVYAAATHCTASSSPIRSRCRRWPDPQPLPPSMIYGAAMALFSKWCCRVFWR